MTFIPVSDCVICRKPLDAKGRHQHRIGKRYHLRKFMEFVRRENAKGRAA